MYFYRKQIVSICIYLALCFSYKLSGTQEHPHWVKPTKCLAQYPVPDPGQWWTLMIEYNRANTHPQFTLPISSSLLLKDFFSDRQYLKHKDISFSFHAYA